MHTATEDLMTVANVGSSSKVAIIWSVMFILTLVQSRTHVDTVQTVLHSLANSRHICWSHTMKVLGSHITFVRRNSATVVVFKTHLIRHEGVQPYVCRSFTCGFSPLWILLWTVRSPDCVNCLLQTVHSNGFSPEWVLCTVKSRLLLKRFPHSVHLYLLLWTFICCFKYLSVAKRFSHWIHEYNFSLACICLWCFRSAFLANHFSHTVHEYSLGLSSCGCSVISLLSASIFTSNELSPVQYAEHAMMQTTLRQSK